MTEEKGAYPVKHCVICGKPFEVRNARDAKREYCDYKSPCRRRWNLLRERERNETRTSEASKAQARTADRLAHAEAKLLIVQEEFAKVDEARRKEHEMFGRFVGQMRLMLRKRIIVLNPQSGHWEEREDYAWAMHVIADWTPTSDPTLPEDKAGLTRKLRQADADYRQAIAEGDLDAAGAAEKRKWKARDEWWKTHPEEWAQYNIAVIRQAYREDNDGEEMADDAIELEWYRDEARRRREALESDTASISGHESDDA